MRLALVTCACLIPVLVFACGSDEDGASEDGVDGGDPASGGQSGSGSGGRSTGGSNTGGSGTGGGPAGSGGMGGGAGGTSGAGGTMADAATGCSGAETAVCVDTANTFAAFLNAAGAVLESGTAPIEYAVPPGGSVVAYTQLGITWVIEVPLGITLSAPEEVVPPPPQPFQDIHITVPAPPVATTTVFSASGCPTTGGAGLAVGEGEVTFAINETCLENGRAAVFVEAGGSYIYVDDIAVGADSSPVLDVTLPAWQSVAGTPPTLNVTNIPAGFMGQATHRARWGQSGALTGSTRNLIINSGTALLNAPEPVDIGVEWSRFLQLDGTDAWSHSHESLGFPLATESIDVDADLMPIIETVTANGPSLSWTYSSTAALAGADWVVVNVRGTGPMGADTLTVVAPADTTSFTLPASLPGELARNALTTIESASFYVEDHQSTNGYAEVLESGERQLQFPGTIADALGRQSFRDWP